MSPSSQSSPDDDELQFTSIEPAGGAGSAGAPGGAGGVATPGTCIGCQQPIISEYFALGDKMLCPACVAKVQAPPTGSRAGRFFKAMMLGLAAGLVGALIWFVIRRVTHLEIGLVAVLVGFMVGKAVRAGSGGRGGRRYQVMAVVLTYCCIAANYMPDVFSALIDVARKEHLTESSTTQPSHASASQAATQPATQPAVAQQNKPHEKPSFGKMALAVLLLLVLVFVASLAAPFLAGAQNLIGLLIIGFALWEAWKFNRARALPITGPYQFGSGATVPAGQLLDDDEGRA